MNEVNWVSVIAIGEFALLMTAILIYLAVVLSRRSRRDNAAARELVDRVKSNEADRGAELDNRLRAALGAEPHEDISELVNELVKAERGFYEDFLKTYLTHDSEAVSRMDVRLQDLASRYLDLNRPDSGEETEPQAEGGGTPEAPKMRDMAEDLILYRNTLNRVFSEYTAMFGVHLDSTQELTAKEILNRLESGQLAGEDAEADPLDDLGTPEDKDEAREQAPPSA